VSYRALTASHHVRCIYLLSLLLVHKFHRSHLCVVFLTLDSFFVLFVMPIIERAWEFPWFAFTEYIIYIHICSWIALVHAGPFFLAVIIHGTRYSNSGQHNFNVVMVWVCHPTGMRGKCAASPLSKRLVLRYSFYLSSTLYRQAYSNPKHPAERRWPQQPTHCMVSSADHLDYILSVDVFSVKGVDQIVWTRSRFSKSPNLYVEIRLEQSVWCTRIVKRSVTPTWDEEFPMRVRS
jgi:hypothetical protein